MKNQMSKKQLRIVLMIMKLFLILEDHKQINVNFMDLINAHFMDLILLSDTFYKLKVLS